MVREALWELKKELKRTRKKHNHHNIKTYMYIIHTLYTYDVTGDNHDKWHT